MTSDCPVSAALYRINTAELKFHSKLSPGTSAVCHGLVSKRKSRKLCNPKLNVPWWFHDDIGITTGHAIFYLVNRE